MKQVLTIGEMSALFKLNVQTLRYYDSIGLFKPVVRDPLTGHRKYRFDQVYKLASILYMRKLGYSLKQINQFMESRNIGFTVEHLKKQSQVLRKKYEELIKIDGAIQRKINFVEEEIKHVNEEITIREFPERWYIPLGGEEALYQTDSFYFYPTIAFYEEDLKYFGAYLSSDKDEAFAMSFEADYPEPSVIPAGKFLCGYHFGPYEKILESSQRIRDLAVDLDLENILINFNIIDQFVERDSENYITALQIPIKE